MTKIKCDNCGEKHDKMHMICECSSCYTFGWKKEGFIKIKKVEELIDTFLVTDLQGNKKPSFDDLFRLKQKLRGERK